MWEEILGKIPQRIKETDAYCCSGASDWGIKKKKNQTENRLYRGELTWLKLLLMKNQESMQRNLEEGKENAVQVSKHFLLTR